MKSSIQELKIIISEASAIIEAGASFHQAKHFQAIIDEASTKIDIMEMRAERAEQAEKVVSVEAPRFESSVPAQLAIIEREEIAIKEFSEVISSLVSQPDMCRHFEGQIRESKESIRIAQAKIALYRGAK